MTSSYFKALVLESNNLANGDIHLVLDEMGIYFHSVSSYEAAKALMEEHAFDLILCESDLSEENGFSVYAKLKQEILPLGMVFFLVLSQQDLEGIMLALEMGIDNVVCLPLRKEVFKRKLENELQKKTRVNLFKTQEFQEYFDNSMIPMFIVEKGIIHQFNPSFHKMGKDLAIKLHGKKIPDLFILEGNENKLNMMRFVNKLVNYCKLSDVPLKQEKAARFHLVLIRNQGCKEDQYLAEIISTDFNAHENYQIPGNISFALERKSHSLKKPVFSLTKREQEILKLSSSGLPIKLIAEQLNLSKRTVEKHRSNIMEKVGANNIIEAITAVKKGSPFLN